MIPWGELEAELDRPLVLFHTPCLREDDGWSIAARRYARAMRMGGIDVRLAPRRETGADSTPAVLREIGPLLNPLPRMPDLAITSTALVRNMAGPLMELPHAALHVVFETADVYPDTARMLNASRGVWAQCSANADLLRAAGTRDVELIGMPWFEDEPLLAVPPPTGSRKFLYVGREEPRKAPDRLAAAFLRAFRPGEAELTVKLSRWRSTFSYPTVEESIADELRTNQWWSASQAAEAIHVIRGRLDPEQMIKLYASSEVYCSASRGEGWDLPAYYSKLAGRRVVSTDSGGIRDFLDEQDVIVPQAGTVPAPDGEAGASYADHYPGNLIAALQHARSLRPGGNRPHAGLLGDEIGRKFRAWVGRLTV